MSKPIARDPIYRRRGFDAEIFELCVRWCISYRLSYDFVLRSCHLLCGGVRLLSLSARTIAISSS